MRMINLSKRTEILVTKIFPNEENKNNVIKKLSIECGDDIPFCENDSPEELDRIRFAVLKLSEGDMDKLEQAIELAKIDWRDLFMEAGFGHDIEAHNKWYGKIIAANDSSK